MVTTNSVLEETARAERLKRLSPAKRTLLVRALRREAGAAVVGERIAARQHAGPVPASFAQQRLWFEHQFEPDTPAYNVASAVRLRGALEVPALERCFNEVLRRHEVLRTTFATEEGEAVQVVAPALTLRLGVQDLEALPPGEREAEARRLAAEEARRPFDLARGPVMRARLLRLRADDHVLLLTLHHVVADGWSLGVLIREVGMLYEAFTRGERSPLPEPSVQYADYALWHREHLRGGELERQLDYWRRQLAGAPDALDLPTDHARGPGQGYEGAVESLVLDAGLTESVRALSRREGATLFMTLLAAFYALLFRLTGQQDVVVGTPIANRNRADIEGLIGFFINMLALRARPSGELTFRELLSGVRETALDAYAHQDLPFEKLLMQLQPRRRPHHAPLFQVTFVLQNVPLSQTVALRDLTLEPFETGAVTPQYDLTLTVWEDADTLTAKMTYRTALFERPTVEHLLQNYEALLRCAVERPDARLDSFEVSAGATEKGRRAAAGAGRAEANLKKLFAARPKAVQVARREFVRKWPLSPDSPLPLVVEPDHPEVSLSVWAGQHLEEIEADLRAHGALLFRGFRADTLARFEQFARAVSPQLFEYRERSSPRSEVGRQIYTSTDHPPDQWIEMHSEHSYSHRWPLKIWFGCLRPAEEGGETPVASNRRVLGLLDPRFVERLAARKVMYVRNYGEGLGVSWQTAFQTADRSEVEAYCRRAGIECEWRGGGRLRTRQVREAVRVHPRTGERVWFNHLNIYNVAMLEPTARESLLRMFDVEDLPFNTYYGDGSPVEASALEEVREAYRRSIVLFPWQPGDVLMLDNMLVAHGRAPYAGRRQIVVAMGDLVGDAV